MKKIVLGILAAATVGLALPAAVQTADAQVVVKERTVVRDGHRMGEGRRMAMRRHHDCRVVKVRTRLPNGNVIIKTRRSC